MPIGEEEGEEGDEKEDGLWETEVLFVWMTNTKICAL